ncbi:MAG: membrane-associated protein [Tepidisphaeraceae bacterium]
MDRAASDVSTLSTGHIAPWIKIVYTLYVCVLVPIYLLHYPPSNFLWFSDIALLTTVVALWLESSLLASMMALAILLPELVWNINFFLRLIFGIEGIGLSTYMFDPHIPLYVRALSLFHVVLPVLLVWMVYRLGYDRRALIAQTLMAVVVLPVTYAVTDPADNINWVFGPGNKPQHYLPPLLYLALLMIFFPLVIYLPARWILSRLFKSAAKR